MERHDFLPRAALSGDDGARDLPPMERVSEERGLTPRMEQGIGNGDGTGCGCGCEHHHHDHHHDHDHDCDGGHGICVGYEGCGEGSWGLSGHPLAMVYAPCQAFRALYDPATALSRGTLFTELDLPLGGSEGAFTTIGCACQHDLRAERSGV